MFVKRVNRFNAITESSELWNKEIQQIDLSLLGVRLYNNAQGLLVKGFIGRQIKYHENDGRLRKIADRIQFTICMGKSVAAPLSLLQTEIEQDYFVFQSGKSGTNKAILDQGFLITVRNMERVDTSPKINVLRVNSIVTQGRGDTIIKIPVNSFRPKAFSGKMHFTDYTHLPVVVAEISGTITGRTPENLLQETDICETVSLLVNAPASSKEQAFFIEGVVKEAGWQVEPMGLDGHMALQLDYQWYLTEPKELHCMEYCSESSLPIEQIQTLIRLDSRSFYFSKNLQITLPETVGEIRLDLEQFSYKNTATRKGLLLTTDLTWEIVFNNSSGVEQYQEFKSQFDELFSHYSNDYQDTNLIRATDLQVKLIKYSAVGHELKIIIDCQYHLNTYQKQITTIIEDNTSQELIYAKILIGKVSFSLTADERFDLKYPPQQIARVTAKLLDVYGEVKKGWLAVNGHLEVHITYIDREHIIREDFFQSIFQDLFTWDKLSDPMEVQISGNLDHDSYRLMDDNVIYHYLIGISAEAFHEKELRIGIVNKPATVVCPSVDTSTSGPSSCITLESLLIEGEIPLIQGNVKEIATSRALISRFNYRNSHNAILVSGNLSGELEYWDEKQYLQKVSIDLPFWRFIRNDPGLRLECCKLIPLVRNCSYLPLQTKPWQKGSIKIRFELEFNQTREDDIT